MDIAVSLAQARTFEQTREALAGAMASDAGFADTYAWAKEVVKGTTGGTINGLMIGPQPPVAGQAPAMPIEVWVHGHLLPENLAKAGEHLEQCVERQDRIFELETLCISAVLDSFSAQQAIAHDQTLALDAAAANAVTANHGQDGLGNAISQAQDAVRAKFDVMRQAFANRTKFYTVPGGALNFNERIAFLRELQADGIRSAYERLQAVRWGMALAGIATLDPVPAWSATDGALLTKLVKWLRRAIRETEKATMAESSMTITISTMTDPDVFRKADGTAFPYNFREVFNDGDLDLSLTLNAALLDRKAGFTALPRMRLIGAGIGAVFGGHEDGDALLDRNDDKKREQWTAVHTYIRRWRAEKRMSARVTPPTQPVQLPGASWNWAPPEVELAGKVTVADSIDAAGLCPIPMTHIGNINPLGTWKITVSDDLISPQRAGKLAELNVPEMTYAAGNIAGVLVSLTFAFR